MDVNNKPNFSSMSVNSHAFASYELNKNFLFLRTKIQPNIIPIKNNNLILNSICESLSLQRMHSFKITYS